MLVPAGMTLGTTIIGIGVGAILLWGLAALTAYVLRMRRSDDRWRG